MSRHTKDRIRGLDSQLEDLERRLDRHYDALESGKLDLDALSPRINKLRQKQELIRRARAEIQEAAVEGKMELINRELVMEYLTDLNGLLDQGTVVERKTFLKAFIKSIEKGDSYVTLNYTIPLPPDRVPNDAVGVLDIVHSGGQ